jgi:hypothetical protein
MLFHSQPTGSFDCAQDDPFCFFIRQEVCVTASVPQIWGGVILSIVEESDGNRHILQFKQTNANQALAGGVILSVSKNLVGVEILAFCQTLKSSVFYMNEQNPLKKFFEKKLDLEITPNVIL